MKIRMDVEGTEVTATLDDNATSRDFVPLLPLRDSQGYAARGRRLIAVRERQTVMTV